MSANRNREDLERWFLAGKESGATHMLVVCDTFDWENYPVYVMPGENAREEASKYAGPNMQKLMEVYDLTKSREEQMEPGTRVFNY